MDATNEIQEDLVIRPGIPHVPGEPRLPSKPPPETALPPGTRAVSLNLAGVRVLNAHDVGAGEVQVVSMLVDGLSKDPVSVRLEAWEQVEDGADLPILEPGISLYRHEGAPPPFLDWRLLIIESDSGVRDTGKLVAALGDHADWRALSTALRELLAPGNPVLAAVVIVTAELMKVVGSVLMANRDDQIAYLAVTYDRDLDSLGLGRHVVRVGDAVVAWTIRAA